MLLIRIINNAAFQYISTFFITTYLETSLQLIDSFFVKIHSSFLCCQASFE